MKKGCVVSVLIGLKMEENYYNITMLVIRYCNEVSLSVIQSGKLTDNCSLVSMCNVIFCNIHEVINPQPYKLMEGLT